MPRRHLRLRAPDTAEGAGLRAGFAAIRAQLGVPGEFPADVLAEAHAAAGSQPAPSEDATEIPLLTIDPPGSMDLDQALHIERRDGGYRVRYAIADVASFVRPGGAIDLEADRRVETLYSPDTRTPLHPTELSEGAASLLPAQIRPAVLWTVDLDDTGDQRAVDVRRARVRSTDRFDYATVQTALDAGTADERLILLAEVGRLREQQEVRRGGISLPIPEQEISQVDGSFQLAYRRPLPVEGFNASISLLTGMAAADLMLGGKVGILRTLPPPTKAAIATLRRTATALGVAWPEGTPYAEVVHGLDPANPSHLARIDAATSLLRGAGYSAFDGSVPDQVTHAAVAAPYAHATAPLRRLVDRYVGEVCLALCGSQAVPDRVRSALPGLPALMAASDHRAGALERECVNLMEATALRDAVGQVFDAVVVDVDGKGHSTVALREPAVRARCDGELPLGASVRVRLAEADPGRRVVRFKPA